MELHLQVTWVEWVLLKLLLYQTYVWQYLFVCKRLRTIKNLRKHLEIIVFPIYLVYYLIEWIFSVLNFDRFKVYYLDIYFASCTVLLLHRIIVKAVLTWSLWAVRGALLGPASLKYSCGFLRHLLLFFLFFVKGVDREQECCHSLLLCVFLLTCWRGH